MRWILLSSSIRIKEFSELNRIMIIIYQNVRISRIQGVISSSVNSNILKIMILFL